MKREGTARGERQSAEERRETVLAAAIVEFAAYGLHGASTEDIARRAGISQPYIFRLFGTKKDLFIAAANRVYERIHDLFQAAAATAPGTDPGAAFGAMALSYKALIASRDELLLILQSFAAASDPEVGAAMRERFGDLYRYVEGVAGGDEHEAHTFMAYGMLLTVTAALGLPTLPRKEDSVDTYLSTFVDTLP